MSATIIDFKTSGKDPGWVEVHLDDHRVFSVRLLDSARLKIGQTLGCEEIERFSARDAFRRSYTRAIRFLGVRSRSCKEVEDHLLKKGFPAASIRKTIDQLIEQNYLDDRAFAISWVRQRSRLKPRSHLVLRKELIQKGIGADNIDNALERVDEYEMAQKSVDQRMKRWAATDRSELKRRILQYLHNNGFGYDISDKAYRHVCCRLEETGDQP